MKEVYLAEFPYSESPGGKLRPVVMLTQPQGVHQLAVVAYVTSKMPETLLPGDLVLGKDTRGLKGVSVVRSHKLVSLPLPNFRRYLTELSDTEAKALQQKIRSLFDL